MSKDVMDEVTVSSEELLLLEDAVSDALHTFAGVREALGHVGDESNDYDMCQMLGNAMDAEIQKVFRALPKAWNLVPFMY